MKIITTNTANIRQKPTTASPILQTVAVGTILDATSLKTGQIVAGNGKWYELSIGGYLWSGLAKEYTRPEIVLYSQNDWRWKNKYLGYSNSSTLGDYGCAITSCAMLAGIRPDTLNENMKRVGGYKDITLLVWGALERATGRSIKYIQGAGRPYNNNTCLRIIKEQGGCVVEMTNRYIPMHFVVAIGNGMIYDPIDGKKKPFTSYNAVSLREIARQ